MPLLGIQPANTSEERSRIRGIIIFIILFGAVIVLRLFTLQIIKAKTYQEKAEHQYLSPSGGSFDRGTIFLTNKDGSTIAAAAIASGFKIAINPSAISDPEAVYTALTALTPIDRDTFFTKAQKKNDPYEEIANRIDADTAKAITTAAISGVNVYREKWRFYPGGTLAANTIGFVSYKEDDLTGRYGLERSYNDVLLRNTGSFYVNFFAEIFANLQSAIFQNTKTTGDVVTSIEPTVQAQMDATVAAIRTKWQSDNTGAVVLDPATGAVIAMSNAPTFDANNFSSVKDVADFNNPIVEGVYEMGSIVKPLVMAAAIETTAVTPKTTYTDRGSVVVNDRTIYNFDKKGRGVATMQDVLNQSLNTGMVFVEQKMGKASLKEYLVDHYRLGEKTGVDLPGEIKGRLQNLNGTNDVNYATAAFGQGIATTPINIVRAYAAIANGGTLVTPHIAIAINEENGGTKTLTYPRYDHVLKPETVQTITSMLTTVVDIGYKRGLAHYTVAAKTGTAQIAKPDGSGYYDDRHLHSLIGFFPATHPQFVIYFFNVNPKGVQFAAQSLSDPFFDTIQFLANYYGVNPDR